MKIWGNESQEGEKFNVVIDVLLSAAQLGSSRVKIALAEILVFSNLYQRGSCSFGLQGSLIGLGIVNGNDGELSKALPRAAQETEKLRAKRVDSKFD